MYPGYAVPVNSKLCWYTYSVVVSVVFPSLSLTYTEYVPGFKYWLSGKYSPEWSQAFFLFSLPFPSSKDNFPS